MTYIAHQPEEIPKLFTEAWEQRDARGLASLFADDADFINVTGLYWNNREDIFKAHDYGLRIIFKDSILKLKKTKVRYLTDEIAIVHADTELQNQTDLHGKINPQKRKNKFVFAVQRRQDRWLCVSAQNTEVLMGAETFLKKQDGSYNAVTYRSPKNKEHANKEP